MNINTQSMQIQYKKLPPAQLEMIGAGKFLANEDFRQRKIDQLNWNENGPKIPLTVIVTYDYDSVTPIEEFALDYTQELNQELLKRNAPYQFDTITPVEVPSDKDHVRGMTEQIDKPPKGSWILLSFLGKSTVTNTTNYNKIRQIGSEKGWITQCITASRSSLDKKKKKK